MTKDPIQRLLDEHADLMSRFEPLRQAVHLLGEGGDAALPVVLPALREASRVMQSDLLAHAHREDEVLFGAVEEVFGREFGPIVVMRQEHREIHGNADLFRNTLHELHEVEHPAIESGAARLKTQLEAGAGADTLRATGADLLAMLDAHFGKEEDILFPLARQALSADALRDVARRMDELDAG
jgi:regulator of cell morphogenesis and NO signaling